jgi:hypothetical protein
MATKSYVYLLSRRDFDHHTDRKGSLKILSTHGDVASANAAGAAHLAKELRKARYDSEEDVD